MNKGKDRIGTSLAYACYKGQSNDVIGTLLDHGCAAGSVDYRGENLYHCAARCELGDSQGARVVRYLFERIKDDPRGGNIQAMADTPAKLPKGANGAKPPVEFAREQSRPQTAATIEGLLKDRKSRQTELIREAERKKGNRKEK